MKKKYVVGVVCLVAVLLFVLVDQRNQQALKKQEEAEIGETDVRADYDVLRAGELEMDQVTDDYLISVKDLLERRSDGKEIRGMIWSVGQELTKKKSGKLYVSARPVYLWDAGQSKVYEKQVLLIVFDESLSKMGYCKLTFDRTKSGDQRGLADVEGTTLEDAWYLRQNPSQEYVYVSVSRDDTEKSDWRENVLMDSDSSIVTGTNGWGYFSVTAKGDYFGAIRKVKELTFSYDSLMKPENLIEITE